MAIEINETEEDGDLGIGEPLLQRSVFGWIKDDTSAGAKLHQTITAKEVAEQHGIPQKELIRYLKGEMQEAEACFSLPFTLMLVFSFAIMALAHDDAITISAVENSLMEDIHENANFALTGPMGHKGMDDVNSFVDFWSWLRIGLFPLVYVDRKSFHEGWEESTALPAFLNLSKEVLPPNQRGFWLNFNRIVGGIRMSQERMAAEEECTTVPDLLPLYNHKCVGGLDYNLEPELGLPSEQAQVGGLDYNLEPELGLPSEQAQVTVDPARVTWIWAATSMDEITRHLKIMEADQWLDRLTKKIEIAIPSYNAEFGLHTLTRVNFYFSRGGHIWKRILPMSQYADWHDRWYYGLYDAIWLSCIFYLFTYELVQLLKLVRKRGCGAIFSEYLHLWNFIDWASVIGGFVIIIIFFVSITMRNEMNDTLLKINDSTNVNGNFFKRTVKTYVEQLQNNVNYVRHLRNAVAVYPLVIIIRLFKSFSAQPKLALVTKTLASAGPDLFHFSIVFGSVFITFTICGIVLFGRELSSFTTFNRAVIACFRILMGDIDWEELNQIGRAEASIWLWLYIVIVALLMLNMIIAIIMDHYEEVKSSSGNAETLFEEAYQMWHRWKGKRAGTFLPLEIIEAALLDEQRKEKERTSRLQPQKSRLNFLVRGATRALHNSTTEEKTRAEDEQDAGEEPPLHESMNRGTTDTLDEGETIMTIESLLKIVNRSSKVKMRETQALEVMKGAVGEFYEQNKKGAEIEEILQLTQKTNFRVKKLVRLAREAHSKRDKAPMQELEWFGKDVNSYLEALMQERKDNMAMLDSLNKEKLELETRLISLGGGFVKSETVNVNKRASIMRTAHRMTLAGR